jgi:drug/metabolite transporter (DMT)-like permease
VPAREGAAHAVNRSLPLLVLALAVGSVSFGSILIRLADAPPLAIAAWRVALASLVVVPAALAFGERRLADRRTEGLAVLAGVLLALHFATWIASLRYTTVAQSVVLVNTAPVWVAIFARLLRLGGTERTPWLGIAACVAGSALVAAAPTEAAGAAGSRPALGNGLALAGALCMGGYLLAARAAQQALDFLGFVARAYGVAALVLIVTVALSGTRAWGFDARTWAALFGLAVVAQLLGHGGTNWSLRHLGPAFVAIALVAEPVLASLLAWALLDEPVTALVATGGALVLAGIVIAARARAA